MSMFVTSARAELFRQTHGSRVGGNDSLALRHSVSPYCKFGAIKTDEAGFWPWLEPFSGKGV